MMKYCALWVSADTTQIQDTRYYTQSTRPNNSGVNKITMSRGTLLTQRYNNKSVALAKTIIRSHFREISAGVRCDNEENPKKSTRKEC
ncbi:uncharacterized protein Dsimw501_GD29313 [Drosophila simulans]|nr:uncharacterized protein Dsimw501_GD29313 [Drosophila simulans]